MDSGTRNPLSVLLTSSGLSARLLRYLLVLLAVLLGLGTWELVVKVTFPPYSYRKDFVQEYLLAKAALSHVNPYQVLPELSARFLPYLPNRLFPHPTPHPPPVILVAWPLGLLSYEQAQAVWLVAEIICLVAAIWLLLTTWCLRHSMRWTLLLTLIAVPFFHFWEELIVGQAMILLLLVVSSAWRALRSRRELVGGVLLGLAVALKLIVWPLVVLLMLQKMWRAVLAAGVTVGMANLIAALIMGPHAVIYYYSIVSRMVWSLYRSHEGNLSLLSIGWRLFEGTGSPILVGVQAAPLIGAPDLAFPVSLAVVTGWLMISFALAARARSFDVAFGMVVCASVLVSPIVWSHYLVLLTLPVAVTVRQLAVVGFPRRYVNLLLLMILALSIPAFLLVDIMALFAFAGETTELGPVIPFATSLISLIPTVAVIALLVFLRVLARATFPNVPMQKSELSGTWMTFYDS